jgi:hypothetical protein
LFAIVLIGIQVHLVGLCGPLPSLICCHWEYIQMVQNWNMSSIEICMCSMVFLEITCNVVAQFGYPFSAWERERERERLIFPIFQPHSDWVLGNEVCLFAHGILLHPNFSSKSARLTLKSWSIQPSQFSKFEQYSQHSKSACEHLLC